MGKLITIGKWVARPQAVVCFVVAALGVNGSVLSLSAMLAPAARTAPTKELAVRQVQGVSTTQPVDCAKLACLALTFDDGPSAQVTPQILDVLQRHNARATFFVLGGHVAGNEALLRREHREGHEIGNHSWSHPHFTRISLEQVEAEIATTQAAIMAAGVPAPHLFRPPYGDMDHSLLAHVPLTVIRWNIDPEDWHPVNRQHLLEHMATHAKPGGMVVMHDTEQTTADALDQLITQLQANNYILVTVSELLNLPSGQAGVFLGR